MFVFIEDTSGGYLVWSLEDAAANAADDDDEGDVQWSLCCKASLCCQEVVFH